MGDMDDFQPVTFQKELDKVISDLRMKPIPVAGLTDDLVEVQLKVKSLQTKTIELEITDVTKRALKAGEILQLLFGLPDGQFLIRATIASVAGGSFSASFDQIFKLQRRNNFRAKVPPTSTIVLRMTSFKSSTAHRSALAVMDLSAGGVRVKWPATGLPVPAANDQLAGTLSLPQGREVEVFGTIKNVATVDGGFQVGVGFQNMSVRDEQALLFLCMQLQKAQSPVA